MRAEPTSDAVSTQAATLFPMGQDGILLRVSDGFQTASQGALALGDAIRASKLVGVVEVATSLASVWVRFDPNTVTRASLAHQLRDLLAQPIDPQSSKARIWTIPAAFGGPSGPQFAAVAQHVGQTEAEAIATLTGTAFSVLAIGFAPGQPYIGHLPSGWHMPRQTDLTPYVPKGALVTAVQQLVLFANPSPTGWRWVGRCAFDPFCADRSEPFALRAGDRVQFVITDADTIDRLRQNQPDRLGGATVEAAP